MSRPRLLLITDLTELEWGIRPLLEEWAEVASFDAPGVGQEPPVEGPVLDAIATRALAELDRREWDTCVFVADEMAIIPAIYAAATRPDSAIGLALGHACLRFTRSGPRPTLNDEILDAWMQMLRSNYSALVREDIKVWDPRLDAVRDQAAADELVDRWLARVRPDVAGQIASQFVAETPGVDLEPPLRSLGKPLLLAAHEGCVGWTHEGFVDAAAAFPQARTFRTAVKPSTDPDFASALRGFCEELDWS